jgi:membrane protein insertase Oxa1/YidC/SpoIIIJ
MTRVAYLPLGIYSQINMHKMKLIKPESDEINNKIQQYFQTGERELASLEMKKHKKLRRDNGIY